MLNEIQRKRLLRIARESIERYLKEDTVLDWGEDDPALKEESGAFVTLNYEGILRGCIGHIQRDKPLYQVVCEMAIEAAVGDPRFAPLTLKELDLLHIEISVVSEFKKIADVNKIEIGEHGLFIKKGIYSGLLLPQVALQLGWDKWKFLENTCIKAGLPKDAWKVGAEIYIFTAEVFGEETRRRGEEDI